MCCFHYKLVNATRHHIMCIVACPLTPQCRTRMGIQQRMRRRIIREVLMLSLYSKCTEGLKAAILFFSKFIFVLIIIRHTFCWISKSLTHVTISQDVKSIAQYFLGVIQTHEKVKSSFVKLMKRFNQVLS